MAGSPHLEGVQLDEVVTELRGAGAAFAYLHGSVAAGTAGGDSDVDVAAFFRGRDPAPWTVRLPGRVDLVLDTAPLELAGRIALHGKRVFDDDPPSRVAWEATTRKIYLDERHRAERARADFAEGIASLRRYAAGDRQALVDDEVRLGHVKYLFVTLMEACIDAAQHVCASEGWGPPDSNAGAMVVLARNGVLPAELGATMADGVRFRNVLVHLYAEVDDNRLVANLDQPDHVERFVACLSVLVDDGPD